MDVIYNLPFSLHLFGNFYAINVIIDEDMLHIYWICHSLSANGLFLDMERIPNFPTLQKIFN